MAILTPTLMVDECHWDYKDDPTSETGVITIKLDCGKSSCSASSAYVPPK